MLAAGLAGCRAGWRAGWLQDLSESELADLEALLSDSGRRVRAAAEDAAAERRRREAAAAAAAAAALAAAAAAAAATGGSGEGGGGDGGGRGDAKLCVACQDAPKDVVLLPCRHLCLCQACASHAALLNCPMCRVPIRQRIPVFA